MRTAESKKKRKIDVRREKKETGRQRKARKNVKSMYEEKRRKQEDSGKQEKT